MYLVVPFASALSPAAGQALSTLQLPTLERLLARLDLVHDDPGEELSLSPPHERAIAAALGWPLADGLLPLAARQARVDGLAPQPGEGWGLLTPTHWHLGTEQVSLVHPDELALDAAGSRALCEAVRPLFEDDDSPGWRLHWGAAERWYAVHPSLADMPSASPDRVIGRNVDWWLGAHPLARPLRRLQAEVQMLLHSHPLNAEREARGLLPVNSFWLSGTGPVQPAAPEPFSIDERLRGPALREDWTAWAEAWAALDAGPLQALLAALDAGQPVQLTLAGERHARRWAPQPRPWYRRGWLGASRVHAAPVLGAL